MLTKLSNLNKHINMWFLLKFQWVGIKVDRDFDQKRSKHINMSMFTHANTFGNNVKHMESLFNIVYDAFHVLFIHYIKEPFTFFRNSNIKVMLYHYEGSNYRTFQIVIKWPQHSPIVRINDAIDCAWCAVHLYQRAPLNSNFWTFRTLREKFEEWPENGFAR
jgi:hypothetical protein